MVHTVQLDLPIPSLQIQQQLIGDLENIQLDPDRKIWLDEFHQGINSAQHAFDLAPETWKSMVESLYQPIFDQHEIQAGFGIMKNTQHMPACLPPHTDRGRALAINYYLELGGSNVQTKFYDVQVQTKLNESTNFSYSYVGPAVHEQVFDQSWYAYSVNRAHSVENIESCRYVLLLLIKNQQQDYTLNDLIRDYPHLIQRRFE